MSKLIRTRIAPSPTGFPHIGTIYQALFNFVYAKKHDGTFLIRIEDTDQARKVENAEEVILQSLDYYGVSPQEGPKIGGDVGPYRQSERLNIYQEHAQQLIDSGHAYYCFCSKERLDQVRKDMQKQGKPPMYDQHCRSLDPKAAKKRAGTEDHVVRMKIPPDETIIVKDLIRGDITFESNVVDDQVILKSDGFPTYHLAVVVDDHLMEISHVVRGEEWISSAPKHILLYQYFGWDLPEFVHLPLLRNPDKSKISKRHGHTSAKWYQEQGYLKEAVRNFLATRVWNHPKGKEIFDIDDLVEYFDWQDMHIHGPIVDLDKLNWLNGQWIRGKSDNELLADLEPYRPDKLSPNLLKQILPHIKERLEKLSDIDSLTGYFYQAPKVDTKLILKQSKMEPTGTADYLNKVIDTLKAVEDWSATSLEATLRDLQRSQELKPRPAFMTVRVAITGQTATPPLFDVMEILGKDEVVIRIESAIKSLS